MSSTDPRAAEPSLAGVRVLDLSRLLPGPYASRVLLDHGAAVDKLEDPGAGDYMRMLPPLHDGMNPLFRALARGMRSAVLDLKSTHGKAAFLRMLPRYDVLIESFRPGVMAKHGLSYDELSQLSPKLIYCSISGYGQTGPRAQKAGHDLNYLARGGVLGVSGPTGAAPHPPGMHVADIGGGLFAVSSVLAALYAREKTRRGCYIDIALSESATQFALVELMAHQANPEQPRGAGLLSGGVATYNTYVTSDGRVATLAALEPKFWNAFCAAIGWNADAEAMLPGPHQETWKKKIASLFASKTAAEWEAFSEANDCCVEVAVLPHELIRDEAWRTRSAFEQAEFDRRELQYPRTPASRAPAHTHAPHQGEHTRAVLTEAGFDEDEINTLTR